MRPPVSLGFLALFACTHNGGVLGDKWPCVLPPLPPTHKHTPHERAAYNHADGDRAYAMGDFDRAIRFYRSSYAWEKNSDVLYNLALAYKQVGKIRHAIWLVKAYLFTTPVTDHNYHVAQEFLQMYTPDQAVCGTMAEEPLDPPPGEGDRWP